MMDNYTFKCPACGSETFEEILINVVQATTFNQVCVEEDMTEPTYLQSATEGGDLDRYQCQNCGHTLKNPDGRKIDNAHDLRAWMEANGRKTDQP
jgi:rubredoxin